MRWSGSRRAVALLRVADDVPRKIHRPTLIERRYNCLVCAEAPGICRARSGRQGSRTPVPRLRDCAKLLRAWRRRIPTSLLTRVQIPPPIHGRDHPKRKAAANSPSPRLRLAQSRLRKIQTLEPHPPTRALPRIPRRGVHRIAQGCEARATLGSNPDSKIRTPSGFHPTQTPHLQKPPEHKAAAGSPAPRRRRQVP